MADKKKVHLEVTIMVTVEIDESNPVVKDYETLSELLSDVVSYRFSPVLPVIDCGGVTFEFNGSAYVIHREPICIVH